MNSQEYIDNEALNGRTFYRAEASPSAVGKSSYIQIFNPSDSGVNVYFDQVYLFGGQAVSSEYALTYYSTPFDDPAVGGSLRGHFWPTKYGAAESKAKIYAGTFAWPLGRIDYFFQVAPNDAQAIAEKFPYPIILGPSTGILLANCVPGFEGKAGMWIREKPAS